MPKASGTVAWVAALAVGLPALAGDLPRTGEEVFDFILKDAARRLTQAHLAFRAVDGGLTFEQKGVAVSLFGNQVARAQTGAQVSWFVPEPNGKSAPDREVQNPPELVGVEILQAIHRRQLVRGIQAGSKGFYLVGFYDYAPQASKLEHSVIIDFKRGTAERMSAPRTEQFLRKLNRLGTASLIEMSHAINESMIRQGTRNNERMLDAQGGMGASYNPWAPQR